MLYTPIRECDYFVYKQCEFVFCDSFVKMTSRVLYSDSNEISSLIESISTWTVSPLERLDDLDRPADILLFDTLFYRLPEKEWTVGELLGKRPEWERQILPLLKARGTAYLFYGEWCAVDYLGEKIDKIEFRPYLNHPMTLAVRDGLFSTQYLTFGEQDEIRRLIRPAIHARAVGERLSKILKRPVDFETPLWFQDVCNKLEELVLELDREVSDWKDRFFFDALDAHEDDLCQECKENMRQSYYVSDDRSQALKWRPHGDWCSHGNCKYFKSDIFEDLYADDVREDPVQ